jgi:predicted nuclease of predicted toxin-antitoxin system
MPSGPRSRLLPEPWIFFIDRSLGGQVVAEALRAAGEQVEVHDDHFARDATDEVWLAAVGAKGWIVLSKDDRIRRDSVERAALVTAGVAAFFLGRSDLRGDQMARALASALPAMKKALRRFSVPFIAGVSMTGDVHVFEDATQRYRPPKRLKS